MKTALLSFASLIAALWIFAGPPTIAAVSLQTVDVTGVWLATGVPFEPWTFNLKQDGTKLTGTLQRSGGGMGPLTIEEGTISGTSISFKTIVPDAGRLQITLAGTVGGNEITLAQSAQGRNRGLFGTSADTKIVLRPRAPQAQAPLRLP